MNSDLNKRPIRPYDDEDGELLFDNEFSVVSATECTGLIPSAPDNAAELSSYSDVYDIPLSQYRNRNVKDSTASDPKI